MMWVELESQKDSIMSLFERTSVEGSMGERHVKKKMKLTAP